MSKPNKHFSWVKFGYPLTGLSLLFCRIKAEAIAAIPKIDRAKLYKRRKDFVKEDEDEEDPMTIDVPIVPLPAEDDDEDYQEGGHHSESEEDDAEESLSDDLGGNGRNFDDTGFVEDDDGDGSYLERRNRTGSPRKNRTKRRVVRSGSKLAGKSGDRRGKPSKRKRNIEDENDEELQRTSTQSGGRLRRRHVVRYKESDVSMDEYEDEDDESEEIEVGENDDAEEMVNVDDDENAGEGSSKFPKKRRRLTSKNHSNGSSRGKRKGRVVSVDKDDVVEETPSIINIQHYLPSKWISSVTSRPSPYHPQLGDYVAYFGQGHQQYWERSTMTNKFNAKNGPFEPPDSVMFGEIMKIEWYIGPPTWCRLKIRLMDLRNVEQVIWVGENYDWHRDSMKRELHIDFCDEEGMPDFIVLLSRFIDGMRQTFEIGASVNVRYDDGLWLGTIVERVDNGKAWEKVSMPSPWQCFRIAW